MCSRSILEAEITSADLNLRFFKYAKFCMERHTGYGDIPVFARYHGIPYKGARSHSAAVYFIRFGVFVPLRCGVGARGYPHTETCSPLLPLYTPRTWPSASEDLAIYDVPREDPPVGAFEVTLGALHLDSNDTNALGSGWGVPRA